MSTSTTGEKQNFHNTNQRELEENILTLSRRKFPPWDFRTPLRKSCQAAGED